MGGVGLRRGRTHPDKIYAGDALDFWRVLLADKKKKRLLLFAEMKLPGEAWLEFRIEGDTIFKQQPFVHADYGEDCIGTALSPFTSLFLKE